MLPLPAAVPSHATARRSSSGRDSVFAGVSDFAYVPRDAQAEIASGAGGRFALAGAKCERRLPARYGPAPEVPVEARGGGTCARQVSDFLRRRLRCDRLIAVEVITPAATGPRTRRTSTTSTAPASKSVLEEIYYFEIRRAPPGSAISAFPVRDGRGIDVLAEVRDRRRVLVPDGWHGPSIAGARATTCTTSTSWRGRERAGMADLLPPGPRLDPRHLGITCHVDRDADDRRIARRG